MEDKKVDYNIEYAHIYSDCLFGYEQRESIKVLKKLIIELERSHKSYSLSILIDEYNPSIHRLKIDDFIKLLDKLGALPNFIEFESNLTKEKDILLEKMRSKTKNEYHKYIASHNKLPCSFLVAIWYLRRLGIFENINIALKNLNNNAPFIGKRIITILPEKYRAIEKKTLQIIECSEYKSCLPKINHIFFPTVNKSDITMEKIKEKL
ncbi:MAG: hypothetical protein V1891_04905 [bacterium]